MPATVRHVCVQLPVNSAGWTMINFRPGVVRRPGILGWAADPVITRCPVSGRAASRSLLMQAS